MRRIEIHSAEVIALFRTDFSRCCVYAAAMDEIASAVLEDRASFNAYLDEFDRYIGEISGYTSEITKKIRQAADGRKASRPRAQVINLSCLSVRSVQLAYAFAGADEAIRHASYLLLKEQMTPESYDKTLGRVMKQIDRTVRGLKKTHEKCLARAQAILDQESEDDESGPVKTRRRRRDATEALRINPGQLAFPSE